MDENTKPLLFSHWFTATNAVRAARMDVPRKAVAELMPVIPRWGISSSESEPLTHREKAWGVNKMVGLLVCRESGATPGQASSVLNSLSRLKLHPWAQEKGVQKAAGISVWYRAWRRTLPSPRFYWEAAGALCSDSVLEGSKRAEQTLVKILPVQ